MMYPRIRGKHHGWDTQLNVMIQHYELMYIVPGSLELEQVPTVKARVAELLKLVGVTVTSEVELERRRLGYPINHQTYGYYQVVQFDADQELIKVLDAKLKLENEVLRYLLVKSVVQSTERIKELVAGEQYKRQKPQAAEVKTEVTASTSATALTEAELVFAQSVSSKHVNEVEAEDKKVSIEELDKKLDAILEDTDLDKKL